MTYPLSLPYGNVFVYKIDSNRSTYHNIQAPTNFNWGTVYQISNAGSSMGTQLGQVVLFKGTDQVCQLAISSITYILLPEVKIAATENNN
jgi:hypothetical protein